MCACQWLRVCQSLAYAPAWLFDLSRHCKLTADKRQLQTDKEVSKVTATQKTGMASCSFCGKSYPQIRSLVAGPGVFICNECVALSQQVLANKGTVISQVAPWQQVDNVDLILENLPRIAKANTRVEESLTGWVRRARELGATWARIGDALGMTRQSAWARFSGEKNQK